MKNWMMVRFGKMVLGAALLIGLNAATLSAQSVNPNALKSFQAASGGANAAWVAGPNNSWEATWAKADQKMVYCYDQLGTLQQKKVVASISTFPATINSSVQAAYPNAKIQYAYKVVDRSNQKFYEVQVASNGGVDRMRYSLEGKPLGKTSVSSTPALASAQPVVKPATTSPAAVKPAPVPASAKPSSPPMAMRGEQATTTVIDDNDDDLGDLLEDDVDVEDLLKDDDNWDDIDLDSADDDSDLLEDDGLDLDENFDLDDDGGN